MHIDVTTFSGSCTCGRNHEIYVKDIIIESGAVKRLPEYLAHIFHGNYAKIGILCDSNTYKAAGRKAEAVLPGSYTVILPAENLHADNHGVELAEEMLAGMKDLKLILAVGSGTIHDITRYLSNILSVPFVSVPTAASVDGFVSTVAAMTWNGMKKTIPAVSPVLVVADTDVFSEAPYRLTASGISDLLGKYTALIDWEVSHIVTGEYICTRVCELELKALKEVCSCLPQLRNYNSEEVRKQAYEQLMYALLLSGLAMQMIGNSRPASGSEHHMSHLWEMEVINGPLDAYHGEKVSIGLMIATKTYHKVKNAIRNGFCSVKPYKGLEYDILKEAFAPKGLYEDIITENTPDPLAGINEEKFKQQLPDIARILDKLPTEEEINRLLTAAGCIKDVQEIELEEGIIPKTIRLSPYVRNRLTFLRLTKLLRL
ncbi:hypothetical protein acsn021_27200 [Anaerocolumna cellulosilytica]|uniref:Uncharacterized protein n=1 Tax=Anaerocolumna cellulosilytica TaxID=433286 RepID=A0A6S6R869_9FIRM|nr:sn-glycerol-1-phosphate dehydrogenase [Anaerocolumna cellulosilytica]MBB5197969.1 glycerol-1-phosphate dehydrogenase [NAD(P)+] [Anaerocolumna cellulosilytica]BCJ95151.1 hypothetical protein acsn021_27200 [Anaerocolumna cellulosilytica]